MRLDELFPYALAIMLVVEGIMPLVAPRVWRDVLVRISTLADGQIRFIGLSSISLGMLLLIVLQ